MRFVLWVEGYAAWPKVKAASYKLKHHHHHPSKKLIIITIIWKQSNNCGHTLPKVIYVKKQEKKLCSENLIMGKLWGRCSWCQRQGKVHLTQNLLREPLPSYFYPLFHVTNVVTYFCKSLEMVALQKLTKNKSYRADTRGKKRYIIRRTLKEKRYKNALMPHMSVWEHLWMTSSQF